MKPFNEASTVIEYEKLIQLGQQEATNYHEAKPYAHAVFDNAFSEQMLEQVLEEFELTDDENSQNWKGYDTEHERKKQMNIDLALGPVTRRFVHELNSAPFLEFLEKLTGIKGLIPDPYLKGGGLHKIPRGGKLGVHVDFNRHKQMNVFRRLNVIVYLNKDWAEEYGGHFELWNETKEGCSKRVLPVFNRMAIFTTTNKSFHGHPEPLNCPEGRYRRSLAMYYYTAEDEGEQLARDHSTIFLDEGGERIKPKNSVLKRIKNLWS